MKTKYKIGDFIVFERGITGWYSFGLITKIEVTKDGITYFCGLEKTKEEKIEENEKGFVDWLKKEKQKELDEINKRYNTILSDYLKTKKEATKND